MNIRTVVLLWLAGMFGAVLSSAWWGISILSLRYKPDTFNWGPVLGLVAVGGTMVAAVALVATIWYLIEKGDK